MSVCVYVYMCVCGGHASFEAIVANINFIFHTYAYFPVIGRPGVEYPSGSLGSTYFLMTSSDLDDIWPVRTDKRSYFCGKQFTVDGLLECTEQCASLSCPIVEEQHINMISYIPVCNIWQKETCASLGLTLIHGNHSHVQQPIMINASHHPAATTRIAADGSCFFRSISFVATGSQDFHHELHLLITTHMI